MRTPSPSPAEFRRSVIAVPPLALRPDYSFSPGDNRLILEHLASGGATTALYGGNANLYNISLKRYALLLDMIEEIAPTQTWVIPSIGPDYGKACDEINILRERAFPTAMVLPLRFPTTSAGVATGLRKLAERFGRPVTAYVKDFDYITPDDLAAVTRDGALCAIKYAVVRDNPADDDHLRELVDKIDVSLIVSGIGERPAVTHWRKFGLNGFTSGSAAVAPSLSTGLLAALTRGDFSEAERLRSLFLPLEDLRDRHSPLRVLHVAVQLADIAKTGPLEPFLSTIEDPGILAEIQGATKALLATRSLWQHGP